MAQEAARPTRNSTAEEWRRIREILANAIELPVDGRSAYLDEACRNDSSIRLRIEELLNAHEAAGAASFDAPVFTAAAGADEIHFADELSLAGRRLSHYYILEKISAGGMAVVYKARDLHLDRLVAIKVLSPESVADSSSKRRFIQEARAASALNHPNIVTVHDVASEDGIDFIVMELVAGTPLDQLIACKKLKMAEVLNYACQIADALATAHGAGIIHRDLKPSNIMVTEHGQAKVLDFGLAKLQAKTSEASGAVSGTAHTEKGVVLGTLAYMSPEQAEGKKLDGRSDIFSFGLVLYEMITGQRAFQGNTKMAVLTAILVQEPKLLTELAPETPPELERLVSRCLRKDPGCRLQHMGDVRLALIELKQESDSGRLLTRAAAHSTFWRWLRSGFAASWAAIVVPSRRHDAWSLALAATVIAAVSTASLLVRFPRAQAFTSVDSIVVADVENLTGKAVFDDTLNQALAIKLHESPYLNLVSQERVRESLRLLGRSPSDRLTRSLAQRVCQKDEAKATLVSSIASSGSRYIISLDALNCQNGTSLAGAQIEASNDEAVVPALGKLVSTVRESLGEPAGSIQRFDAPIEQATSRSLAALKAFSIGESKRAQGDQLGAIPFYQSAVDLDSNFALAYGTLGTIYRNLGEVDRSAQFQRKAFALRDRVSEPERLYITAHYYQDVTGEVDKAIATYEVWAQTYPRDWSPHNNLAVMNLEIGNIEKAAAEGREAVRLNPKNSLPYNNLASAYLRLNQFEDAKQTYQAALAAKLDSSSIHRGLYSIAFFQNDKAGMEREAAWARDKADGYRMFVEEAAAAASEGHVALSRDLSRRAVEGARRGGLSGPASWMAARQALTEAVLGNSIQARAWVTEALTITRGQDSLSGGALALALAGDASGARRLATELGARFQNDSWLQHALIPCVKAAISLNGKNPGTAIDILQDVRPYELGLRSGFYPTYIRGLAYLRQRQPMQAAGEFQRILDHRGVESTSPVYTLALLELARAYALTGNAEASRKAYAEFCHTWKTADQSLRIFGQARSELASLR
ncbi:MAG TPA: protein kinase [Terriglobales bacterium]|nr:protein kinase [Terriglobales bacterium]